MTWSVASSLRKLVRLTALVGCFPWLAQMQSVAAVPQPLTGQPWADMDYGPFLSATIEAPRPATNFAFKGVAIRLAEAFGGTQNEAVVFDTDLLRYSAGWTGSFVAFKGLVFDGGHWAYPRIDGDQVFGNPMTPGWAKDGSFADPREFIYGPLPRDWAHWKGLYLNGGEVVLSYTVGDADVLEMPGLEKAADLTAFSRTINVGRSSRALTLQVAFERNEPAQVVTNLGQTIVRLGDALAVAAVRLPRGARWIATADGHARLHISAAATPARFKVLLARVAPEATSRFAELVERSGPATDLRPLTHGGPPRWPEKLSTRGQRGPDDGPFAVDRLLAPDDNPWHSWMRFGGFDFFEDASRAAICTWSGDVWLVSGLDDKLERLTWQRIATGLFQPLGLKVVEDQIYVLGRDQITRLHDLNGDGETDFYENFNNDIMTAEHFHEFTLDLQTDAAGDFYFMKAARHARDAQHPHHGTFFKVSKDGSRSEVVARGFRAPNGLLVTPRGEFLTTDQEGYWMPANRLNHIEPGKFHGNVWAYSPGEKPRTNNPPFCWIHPKVDRSPSTMAWVTSDRWGPLQDHLLSLSYGVGRIFIVMRETVDGVEQGGITPLPPEFETGIMRSRFNPRDGQLYACGLFGWAGNKTQAGGFYRVRYTGQPVRLPHELHATTNGVVLSFTDPLDPASATDTGNFSVEVWNYQWTENYGSPDFKRNGEKGRDRLAVEAVQLSQDGKTLFLKLPGINPVMQMHIQMNVKAADGPPIRTFVHNTVHVLNPRPGESWLGEQPFTSVRHVQPTLRQETPGLTQTIASQGRIDARVARLIALNVPAGTAPTPFVPAGPFTAKWTGFIKLDVSESFKFRAVGRGQFSLRANGQGVFSAQPLSEATEWTSPLPLQGGLNFIEAIYESPADGDARLRLFWSNEQLVPEPIPPPMLVHEADDAELQRGEQRRLGRELFATRRCARCHLPEQPFKNAMPELAADAPSLDEAGRRFNADWLARWLKQPKAIVPETIMPAVLSADAAEADAQARNVAAYLMTLRQSDRSLASSHESSPPVKERAPEERVREASLHSAEQMKAGEINFAKLGCVACHSFTGEKKLDGDTRRSLDHVRAKFQPQALVEFLRAPTNAFAWTPMPDFKLTTAEAGSLAAYVTAWSAATPEPGATPVLPAGEGDATRGRQLVQSLGCVNCHALRGVENAPVARSLEALAGKSWTSGCLVEERNRRGSAPDFGFTPTERAALRAFVERDLESLRRDTWPEFARRQIVALRCTACHQRDLTPDFWSAVESAATGAQAQPTPLDEEEAALADKTIHRQRPILTWTGEKLRPEWMQEFIAGRLPYKPRPKLEARMPAFAAYARGLAAGLAMEHGCEDHLELSPPADQDLAQAGRALIQKGALGCVDCHAVGAQPALAGTDTTTINFGYIPRRLRRDYFDRYVLDPLRLLPGTMMPRFADDNGQTGITTHFGGDARQQFDAIWNYMQTVPEPPTLPVEKVGGQ